MDLIIRYNMTDTHRCFAIGQFIGAGVLQGTIGLDSEWSYRIPFAVQWAWPLPLMVAAYFMPESPWWLVRQNRMEEAEHSLQRCMAESEKPNAKNIVAMMVHTNAIEEETVKGTSYIDCYRGTDIRRTEIACMAFAGQILSGSEFAYSGTCMSMHSPSRTCTDMNRLLPASWHVGG
jgi:MFS transporter, SP family, general alpha glucoside:H+ symporter